MRALLRRALAGASTLAALAIAAVAVAPAASADGPLLHGSGSTWVQIAMTQWATDVGKFGLNVDYQGIGSTAGRQNYMYGLNDFGATEIPYQPDELAQFHRELGSRFRTYQYLPTVAGGTAFMYNLNDPATGARITRLRLSTATVAAIFTGQINRWRDDRIVADNPGLNLPDIPLIPVDRSDSSGTSAQLSLYLSNTSPDIWKPFSDSIGCPAPCSNWSSNRPFVGQSLSSGVTNYVASTAGAINYVEAGYALAKGFPVAYVRNASGSYTLPLSGNVATALVHARLNADLTQDLRSVYVSPEANAYPISSYSYMIAPTDNISPEKGAVLGKFLLYVACAAQASAARLGYSPLPPNLIQVVFDAINRINGHPATPDLSTAVGRSACANPTLTAPGGGTPPPTTTPRTGPTTTVASGGTPAPGGGGGPGTTAAAGGSGRGAGAGAGAGAGSGGDAAGGSPDSTVAAGGPGSGPAGGDTGTGDTTSSGAGAGTGATGGAGGASFGDTGTFDSGAPTVFDEGKAAQDVVNARRLAAFGAVAKVHPASASAITLAALYVPLLVFGPLLIRRRVKASASSGGPS